MNALYLLHECRRRGLTLRAESGRLLCEGPTGALNPEFRAGQVDTGFVERKWLADPPAPDPALVEWAAIPGTNVDAAAYWQCVLDVACNIMKETRSEADERLLPRRYGDIHIRRICRNPAHGTLRTVDFPCDHPNAGAVFSFDLRDLGGEDVLIPRRGHFKIRRQIDPQLKSGDAFRTNLRHFLMEDAATGGHPL